MFTVINVIQTVNTTKCFYKSLIKYQLTCSVKADVFLHILLCKYYEVYIYICVIAEI